MQVSPMMGHFVNRSIMGGLTKEQIERLWPVLLGGLGQVSPLVGHLVNRSIMGGLIEEQTERLKEGER